MGMSGRRFGAWLLASLRATRRALPYLVGGIPGSLVALVYVPVFVLCLLLGFGYMMLPALVRFLRWRARVDRRRTARFTGDPIPQSYDPPAEGRWGEQVPALLVPATFRDLYWLFVHGWTGSVFGLLAIGLPLSAINAVAVPFYWWAMPAGSGHPVTSWVGALSMVPVAAACAVLALMLVPRCARWEATLARKRLVPPPDDELTRRVAELTASRAAALEAHGAELRRIERDLHDGTQNRLVAVMMQLGIAERALRRDPETALPLVLRAQNAAGDALGELRNVVRSIYPPVLAERGLDGAVAGLVARCPVPCTLTADGLRRAPAAVESAAYFTVAEALTNVAKHSGAERAEVRLSTDHGLLVIEVIDDGHGGAAEDAGTGLVGIRRRVAAFDGRTELSSPPGGPTVLRAELPCGS
ncbi:MAG TPA: sensor domain-containing protein [Actinophytocola sp.]|uniref:sensor histidine kinase n=1 Tax=Actinophytocola sp. TaxID=1872138 RepID=UPI002DDCD5A9|nr:sensor domain-containing protein [Actinophytocola sp.]HEV2784342.1 sensor domain-containing protein [Actinophytocola sp.]